MKSFLLPVLLVLNLSSCSFFFGGFGEDESAETDTGEDLPAPEEVIDEGNESDTELIPAPSTMGTSEADKPQIDLTRSGGFDLGPNPAQKLPEKKDLTAPVLPVNSLGDEDTSSAVVVQPQ